MKIFGEFIPIRAQVAALEQFSDHADPPELLEWLRTFKNKPRVTYLVHGEPQASSQLRELMKKELGWNVQVAEYTGTGGRLITERRNGRQNAQVLRFAQDDRAGEGAGGELSWGEELLPLGELVSDPAARFVTFTVYQFSLTSETVPIKLFRAVILSEAKDLCISLLAPRRYELSRAPRLLRLHSDEPIKDALCWSDRQPAPSCLATQAGKRIGVLQALQDRPAGVLREL